MRLVELIEFKKPGRVDVRRGAGGQLESAVIRGVKVLGNRSKNKNPDGTHNTYPLPARRAAERLYEGALVNVDHPARRGEVRSYAHRIGRLRAVKAEADGTFADLHVNPKHALAEQLVWDAQNAPDSLGLSHVAQGRGRVKNGETVMEAIVSVESVDVVGKAATTGGLFEAHRPAAPTRSTPRPAPRLTDAEARKQLGEAQLRVVVMARQATRLSEGQRRELVETAKRVDELSEARGMGGGCAKRVRELLEQHRASPCDVVRERHGLKASAPAIEGRAPRSPVDVIRERYGLKSKNTPAPGAPVSALEGQAPRKDR